MGIPAMIAPTMDTMKEIGYRQALVFHGKNSSGTKGMDEMSTLGPTTVMELDRHGTVSSYVVDPRKMGMGAAREEDLLTSGDRELEALRILRLLRGEEAGPRQDIVCLNAAPILYMMGSSDSLEAGVERARSILDSGRAIKKLQDWIRAQSSDPALGEGKFNDLMARADTPA